MGVVSFRTKISPYNVDTFTPGGRKIFDVIFLESEIAELEFKDIIKPMFWDMLHKSLGFHI